jgi:hypothetical protein
MAARRQHGRVRVQACVIGMTLQRAADVSSKLAICLQTVIRAGDLVATDDGDRCRDAGNDRAVAAPVSIGGSVPAAVPIIVSVGGSGIVSVGGSGIVTVGGSGIVPIGGSVTGAVAAAIIGAAAANLAGAGHTARMGAAHRGSTSAVAASDGSVAGSSCGSRVTSCGVLRSRRLGGEQHAAHCRRSGENDCDLEHKTVSRRKTLRSK